MGTRKTKSCSLRRHLRCLRQDNRWYKIYSFHHPDYDLCEKCEPYHHREHLMIRITEPQVLTQAMRGNNLMELDMFVTNYGMGLPNIHAPNYGMELPTMQMRQCPFRRQNKPKTPEKKAPVFKVVGIN